MTGKRSSRSKESSSSSSRVLASRWQRLNKTVTECAACPRLRDHCQVVADQKRRAYRDEVYWGKPLPNLGTPPARLVIVGLAPGAHGANRTGRMFTGDRSGQWLFRALHRAGFANQASWENRDDGLVLSDCVITNVCRCAPPDNKPESGEIANCRPFLEQTLELCQPRVVLCLGQLAWQAVWRFAVEQSWHSGPRPEFGHGACVEVSGPRSILGSYHPSQQNTFTGRLTEPMFDAVFATARNLLERSS